MPSTARGSRYRIAFGKQSAEGTAQATPAWEPTMYDGGSIKPMKDEQPYEGMDTSDMPLGYYITHMWSEGNPVISCDPDSQPFFWYVHLGTLGTAGGPTDYVHTITKGDTKPLITVYQMRPAVAGGTDIWERMIDGYVKAVEFRAAVGKQCQLALEILGKSHEFSVTVPVPTNNQRLPGIKNTMLQFIGATLKLDLDGGTPAQTHQIDNLVIRSEYPDMIWEQTDELTGRYQDLGNYNLSTTFDMKLQDYAAYAATFFGTETVAAATLPGMAQSSLVLVGSADFLFPQGPTVNAARSLQIVEPNMRWEVTPPEPSAAGEAIKVTLAGKLQAPTSGSPITVTGKSGIATY